MTEVAMNLPANARVEAFLADRRAPVTSETLLQRITRGEADAWATFVQLYQPVVTRWLRWLQVPAVELEDVQQEVFLVLAKKIPTLEDYTGGCCFRRWLWTVSRSKAVDCFRRCKDQKEIFPHFLAWDPAMLSDAPEDPPTDAHSDQWLVCNEAMKKIRDRSAPATWDAFWYTIIEAQDPAEVAEKLGVTRWAVYKNRTRVIKQLRQLLEGLLEPQPEDSRGD